MSEDPLFSEILIDLAKNPPNKGCNSAAPLHFAGGNPICGDAVKFSLLPEDTLIKEIRFDAAGCILSRAGAAVATLLTKGKTFEQIAQLRPEDVFEELGNIVQTRVRCALLGLYVVKEGLTIYQREGKSTVEGISWD